MPAGTKNRARVGLGAPNSHPRTGGWGGYWVKERDGEKQ